MLFKNLRDMLLKTTNVPEEMGHGYGNYCGYKISGPLPPADGYDE